METFLTDKSKTCNNKLNENDKTIKDGEKITNKFHKRFEKYYQKLNLKKDNETSFQESCRIIKQNFEKKNMVKRLQTQLRIFLQQGKCFK